MPPKGHAILSASSSDRWLHCPPSARLCETYEDKGSDYAAEGTDAHELCEYKLKRALGMNAADPTENLSWYNEEMEECANGYASYILEQVEAAKETCSDPKVLIEQRVDFSRWVEEGFGTADCIIIADGTLRICDYISGTNTKNRDEFNRMIDECEAGNIDMIITKSISRFARNTLDCLKYIRQLKDKNIPVFFEKEAINTMDAKGEVLITIMASLAQQESQSLSQNVKLGLQFRYQNGQVQVNHNHFLGYTKDADGNLIIDPEQAEVVKRIYREYLEGSSMDKIAAGLEADGILTGAGKTKWWASTVKKILTNEKYIGDALLQKTYTTDFLNKTRVKNNGIVPQYYVEGNHEAIIPKEIYLQVQEELVRRRVVKTSANGKKRSYSCNHCFAQIVVCGDCGEMFRRIHWNNRGCKSIVWRCISRLEPGLECHARTVNETVLEDVVVQAINKLLGDKSTYQAQLQQNIAKVIREAQKITSDGIDEQLMELQKELLKKANNKEAYDEIADQIFKLREQRENFTVDTAARDAQIARINDLQDFIKQQRTDLAEFDEALVKRWLKQITVWEDHFTVELKSGLKIDIEG